MSDPLGHIVAKCEQYWNEHNISDAEVHAALECIHRWANEARRAPAPGWVRAIDALPPDPRGELVTYEVRCRVPYFSSYEGQMWGTPELWDDDYEWRPLPAPPAEPGVDP